MLSPIISTKLNGYSWRDSASSFAIAYWRAPPVPLSPIRAKRNGSFLFGSLTPTSARSNGAASVARNVLLSMRSGQGNGVFYVVEDHVRVHVAQHQRPP